VVDIVLEVKVLETFGCAKRGYSSSHFLFNRQERYCLHLLLLLLLLFFFFFNFHFQKKKIKIVFVGMCESSSSLPLRLISYLHFI
jgi:hypothetical protein